MSAAQAAVSSISAVYNAKLNKVAPGAVGIQLGLMAVVGIVAITAFSLLRPNNSVIYQPKVKYSEDDRRPPKLDKGLLAWVPPVLKTKESALMSTIGLDAVCFLRFLRMCRNIFLVTAALTCAVLIPINVVYNLRNVSASNRNYLLILTMAKVRGNYLWAHVVMTYLLTVVLFYFLWTNYSQMVKLRWQWFRSDEYQNTLHARSLIITQVDKRSQTDSGLQNLLQSLQIPYPTTAVQIGRRVGTLPELINRHNDAVRALEGVLTTYFKNPDNLPTKRPSMRIGGWMGMGGKKVDAIDYLTQKIQRFEERIEATRIQINDRKAENYGFASFESVPYAHIVAKRLAGKAKKGAHFELAPQPTDIIWDNITMTDGSRRKNKFFGGILLVVFCFFYCIPLVVVSLLANLAALGAWVKFISDWSDNYPVLFSAFVGVVPPLLSLLLQLFLPVVIRWIASLQGCATHSQADRIVTARYSAFLFITQFFIFSVLGVAVQIAMKLYVEIDGKADASEIWTYVKTIPDQFQSTYIIQSSYWLTIFPLRGASALFDLAQVISLFLVWFRTKLFDRTPREIREWTKPPEFDFPVYYSNHLLIAAVALVYAPLAPLVPLFAAAAFAISMWVYKYQLMYVCVSRVETGGRLWNVAVNRILWGMLMMHALMAVSIGLQTNWFYAIALAPPAVAVIVFKILLTRSFDNRFRWYIPSPEEIAESHIHHADARKGRLQRRFGHPSLHDPLFTPMLHKNIQHLLPTIYNGRIGQSTGQFEGKAVDQNKIGGLTFNMLETHDLAFDRNAYLRQRDEDAMTVSSANALGGTKAAEGGDDYFNQRRAEYLKNGAHGGRESPFGGRDSPYGGGRDSPYGTPLQTPDDLPFELSRMPVHSTNSPSSSTEQLIQYPPSYSSPQQLHQQRGRGHAPQNSSISSQVSLEQYYGQQRDMQAQHAAYHQYAPQYAPPPSQGGQQLERMGTPPQDGRRSASPGPGQAYAPVRSRMSQDWTAGPPLAAAGARRPQEQQPYPDFPRMESSDRMDSGGRQQ